MNAWSLQKNYTAVVFNSVRDYSINKLKWWLSRVNALTESSTNKRFRPRNSFVSLVIPFHTACALALTVHLIVDEFNFVNGVCLMNSIFSWCCKVFGSMLLSFSRMQTLSQYYIEAVTSVGCMSCYLSSPHLMLLVVGVLILGYVPGLWGAGSL